MNWDLIVGLALFVAGLVATAILLIREECRRRRREDWTTLS